MNNLDFRFGKSCIFTLVFALFLLWGGNYLFPLNIGSWRLDKIIEQLQSFMLLAIAVHTFIYAQRYGKHSHTRKFWYWTLLWWFVIFGRGISWGREFYPQVPPIIYRIISIIIIGAPIITMFFPAIRRQIYYRFWFQKIPVWNVILAFLFLGISDIIEHHRVGVNFLLCSSERQDLLEELMEVPCFLSLIFVVLFLQRNEHNTESNKTC
ncbi:hypothetical protein [Candidatus Schmidhempelia bombi]|uniref:Uncharacterized protein n=1 Tax=Candidatus Schmidhempelia bombi str. Bimp TaxID=1387197 RepID=A0AB94ID18_9GAMM|nr:hypothetical protein [Candidatus Schmidhempelia bombi]TEA27318.1 hypothetical protein O970_04225 [Candidatus Schmidhempelia bombi str. Bimp]